MVAAARCKWERASRNVYAVSKTGELGSDTDFHGASNKNGRLNSELYQA